MKLFGSLHHRRQPAKGFAPQPAMKKQTKPYQTLILEPILTPSGVVDVGEDLPDVADLDLDLGEDTALDDGLISDDAGLLDGDDLADEDFEDVPFLENLAIDFQFESGYFTVGESGEVTIDYLFDGGGYEGELAIFSLEGMEDLVPGSEDFIQMAADRALSESELGHVVISDKTEGARFSGELGESNKNSGDYLGAKTVQMRAGDKFGFMLVPRGEVSDVADNPAIGGSKTPLFSLATANPDDGLHFGQLVDVTGDGNTFVMEDLRTDGKSDLDYNDIIFQVRGATGEAELMDDFIDPAKDWRQGDLGQALIDYADAQADLDLTSYNFPAEDQPLVGVIDTGLSANNPDLDYSRIQLGKDWVDGDDNPLLQTGEGNEHGTHTAGLIGASQDNNLGIDGLNDDAPLWVGRAIGSGQWHESLREFVDAAQDSGQPNAVVNLSLDLTQIDGDGNVTTRYEFTPQEREAIEYARQSGVLIVVAAGNDGGVMSVLGQAAQEFDNILTVGAAAGLTRAEYSSYGNGLGLLAPGGTEENPLLSLVGDGLGTMAGTSVATAQVTGAVSQVWAANPLLSYRQVIEILQATATDLDALGWDAETGAGLLNLAAAVQLAQNTAGEDYIPVPWVAPETWSGEGIVTPLERAVSGGTSINTAIVQTSNVFIDEGRLDAEQSERYHQFTVNESGHFKWTSTKSNNSTQHPIVSVVKSDGTSAWHEFQELSGGGGTTAITVDGLQPQSEISSGGFLDAGTYYLKLRGNSTSAIDYRLETTFEPDVISDFTGNVQITIADDFRQPFTGTKQTNLDIFDKVFWDYSKPIQDGIQEARKTYGLEIKGAETLALKLDAQGEDIDLFISKRIGSGSEYLAIGNTHAIEANGVRKWDLDLSPGQYQVRIDAVDDTQVSYQLTGQFGSETNNAPQPGEGNVPFNAGNHQKTEISNGIVTHYYQNGYLSVQPSGSGVWYALSNGVPSNSFGATTNEPQKIVTPDSDGSLRYATLLNGGSVDFGDGLIRTEKIFVGNATVGDGNLNDYYSFNLTDYRQVTLQLLGLTGKVGFSLIKDIDGDGKIVDEEVIADVMSQDGLATAPRTRNLSPGKYYVRIFPEDINSETINYDLHYKAVPTDADGNGSIPTAKQFGPTADFGYGKWVTGASGSLGTDDLADYYVLQTGEKQEVSLNLEGISEYASLEIIKDFNNNGLVESGEVIHASGWGNTERNLLPYLDAGRYYVRVRSSRGATDYRLNVNGRAYYETDIDIEYQDVNNEPRGFGGETIRLGNATTDYLKGSTSPQGTAGFWRGYENGSINWSEQYGAIAIWYSMNDLYSSMGGSGSWLGFPEKREYQYLDGRRIDFEGGYIFWQPGRQPKAYKYSEFPNEKPRALVNNMELSTDDFTYGVIDSSIGNEFLFPFNRYVGWSDPDGDAIEAVAFYDPTPDQPVNGKYLGNGTGYWAWPGNLASSVSTPPAPTFKGVSGGVIGVDQLNSIYYSHGTGNTNILDEMAVAVFDGYEWSDPKAFNIRVKPGNQAPVVNVWNQTINESDFVQKTLSNTIGSEWVTNMQGRFGWSDPEGQSIQAVAFYDSSPWNSGTGHFAAPDGTTYSVAKQAPNYRGWFKTTVNTKDLDKLYYSHNGNVGITDTVAVSVFDGDKWSQPKEFSIYVKPKNQSSDGPIGSVDIGAEVSDGYLGPVGSINIGVEVLNSQSFSRNFNIINQSLWADDDTQFHFPGFPSETTTLFDEDFFGTQAKLESTTAAYFSLGALDIDLDADFKIHYPSSAKPGEKLKIEIESFLKDGEFDSRVGLSLQAKGSLSITRDNPFPFPDTAIKIDASPFSTPVGDINWGISLLGEIAGNSISGTNSNTDYLDGGTINLRPNFTQTSNLEVKGFKVALHSTDEMSAELGEVVYDAKDINLGKSVFEIVIPDNLKTGDTFYLYPRMKPVTELSSKFGFGISSSLELGKIDAFGLSKRAIDDLSTKADLEYKDLGSVEIDKFDPFDYINGSNGIRSFDWWGEPISIQIR